MTIHEFSSLPKPQQFAMQLFRWFAQLIFFTTDEECTRFEASIGKWGALRQIIPIASNIPMGTPVLSREPIVLYFGQIRPGKGIEEFIQLALLSSGREDNIRFQVLGACPPRHVAYLNSLRQSAPSRVEWLIGATLEEVAGHMSKALACYLPFPDGASYRRGSLMGALLNGLPVISKVSAITPRELMQVILPAQNPDEALKQLERLRDCSALTTDIQVRSRMFAQNFSWRAVVDKHRAVYAAVRIDP